MSNLNDPAVLRRKANQHWEMAGCARQDGDHKDAAHHIEEARKYERMLLEAVQ